jgi:hypothetical protein
MLNRETLFLSSLVLQLRVPEIGPYHLFSVKVSYKPNGVIRCELFQAN